MLVSQHCLLENKLLLTMTSTHLATIEEDNGHCTVCSERPTPQLCFNYGICTTITVSFEVLQSSAWYLHNSAQAQRKGNVSHNHVTARMSAHMRTDARSCAKCPSNNQPQKRINGIPRKTDGISLNT